MAGRPWTLLQSDWLQNVVTIPLLYFFFFFFASCYSAFPVAYKVDVNGRTGGGARGNLPQAIRGPRCRRQPTLRHTSLLLFSQLPKTPFIAKKKKIGLQSYVNNKFEIKKKKKRLIASPAPSDGRNCNWHTNLWCDIVVHAQGVENIYKV